MTARRTAPRASRRNGRGRCRRLRLISNGQNRGKGYSVRHGMLEARGRVALFHRRRSFVPIEESQKLLAAIEAGNDVAIGSRALDRSLDFRSPVASSAKWPELFSTDSCGFSRVCRFTIRNAVSKRSCASRRESFSSSSGSRASVSIPEILFLAKRHGLAHRGSAGALGARPGDESSRVPRQPADVRRSGVAFAGIGCWGGIPNIARPCRKRTPA